MKELQSILEPHLGAIRDLLPSTYHVTLVARYTGSLDADIVLTDDPELPLAADAITALASRSK
jgi:hypothetical protein